MWYDEIQYHNFKGQFQPKSGHFTQVIWKSAKKAGFGRAVSADGKAVYVVGRYTPAGNVQGQFTENVPKSTKPVKPISDDPVAIDDLA
ncbi:Golgi-associated plant pathogenesis protein 1 [Fasciola gigantica]|uniref:Golgi-associated plant pathogenesis protein 1 n=1 Tax=Fasciola gigantica TaxID=46835 RepID=A0A504YYK9_FASGI|nr:Golgi-associated plant pathogenesis protein 1 [Fasciola gigantica]